MLKRFAKNQVITWPDLLKKSNLHFKKPFTLLRITKKYKRFFRLHERV